MPRLRNEHRLQLAECASALTEGAGQGALRCSASKWIARAGCIVALTVVAAGCGSSAKPKPSESAVSCGHYRRDVAVKVHSQTIEAEATVTPAEQRRGLGGRPCIGADQGMLWTYSIPTHPSFWMKDMRFPIDIVWLDSAGRVVWIERNISPSTYPHLFANRGAAALYVLELRAGRAKSLGLKAGTPVTIG
jgi:uncharacterized membrane protein (UPF0127 family)